MPLQVNGSISANNVNQEFGLSGTTEHSFQAAHTGTGTFSSLNQASPMGPNGSTPHSLSEFYGYDHNFQTENTENTTQQVPTTQFVFTTQVVNTVNINSCIVEGQKVRLSSGLLMNIERLQRGDELLGYAIEDMPMDHNVTDEWKITVLDNVRIKPHPVQIISIVPGTNPLYIDINRNTKNNIKLTQEHPLFIKRKVDQAYTYKWMRADEVEVNDYMLRANYFDKHDVVWKQSQDKDWILIENKHVVKEQCIAYGLDVNATDTYVVGNIVVHNGPNASKGNDIVLDVGGGKFN